MKRRGPHLFSDSKWGGAAVEFALVLPILLLILFAILEYGWYFTQQIVLVNAVQQGARASSRMMRTEGEGDDSYKARIISEASRITGDNYWFGTIGNIDVDVGPDAFGAPESVSVTVGGQAFRPLTGYLPDALIPRRLAARSVMFLP